MSRRTLVTGCAIHTVDAGRRHIERGSILVEDGVITAIDDWGTEPARRHHTADRADGPSDVTRDTLVIDGTGLLAVPGFVDTHRHTWQTAFRGVAADWTLEQYGAGMHRTLKPLYTAEDTYIGNLVGRLEALHSGITTMLDWSHGLLSESHSDAAGQALRDTGGRSVFGYGGGFGLPGNDPIEDDLRRLRGGAFASDDGLVTLCLALRGPQYSRRDVVAADVALARELDLRVTVHGGSGPWGRRRPVATLMELGLLDDRTTVVHCNALAEDELSMMAEVGASASVSPDVEMQMGFGWPATGRLLAHGIRPSLSIDDCAAMGGDMFATMRTTMVVQRGLDTQLAATGSAVGDPLTTADVVEFATIEGARACGMGDLVGSLEVGKRADVVLLDIEDPTVHPANNVPGTLVYAAHPGLVRTVLVDGRVVKRDGRLVDVDWPRLRHALEQSRSNLLERLRARVGPVALDGSWMPSDEGMAGSEVNPA